MSAIEWFDCILYYLTPWQEIVNKEGSSAIFWVPFPTFLDLDIYLFDIFMQLVVLWMASIVIPVI